jgi:hypothetical protein
MTTHAMMTRSKTRAEAAAAPNTKPCIYCAVPTSRRCGSCYDKVCEPCAYSANCHLVWLKEYTNYSKRVCGGCYDAYYAGESDEETGDGDI